MGEQKVKELNTYYVVKIQPNRVSIQKRKYATKYIAKLVILNDEITVKVSIEGLHDEEGFIEDVGKFRKEIMKRKLPMNTIHPFTDPLEVVDWLRQHIAWQGFEDEELHYRNRQIYIGSGEFSQVTKLVYVVS